MLLEELELGLLDSLDELGLLELDGSELELDELSLELLLDSEDSDDSLELLGLLDELEELEPDIFDGTLLAAGFPFLGITTAGTFLIPIRLNATVLA